MSAGREEGPGPRQQAASSACPLGAPLGVPPGSTRLLPAARTPHYPRALHQGPLERSQQTERHRRKLPYDWIHLKPPGRGGTTARQIRTRARAASPPLSYRAGFYSTLLLHVAILQRLPWIHHPGIRRQLSGYRVYI